MVEEAEAVQHPVELTEPMIRAAVFRGAVRVFTGGLPADVDDLEVKVVLLLETRLLALRAAADGLPRIARALGRHAKVDPVLLAQIERMAARAVAASPPVLPALPEPGSARKRK